MLKRTMTGALITAVVFLVLWYSYIPGILPSATVVLNCFAVYEIFRAAGKHRNIKLLLMALCCAVCVLMVPFDGYVTVLRYFFPAAAALFLWMMAKQEEIRLDSKAKVFFVSQIPVFLFRAIPELKGMEHGLIYLTLAITLCFATDIGAYLTGILIGKHKLIPKVSPNKTVEGSIGGIVSAALLLLLSGRLLHYSMGYTVNYGTMIFYGVLASVVSQFGDLTMSCVKRICGIKDFGSLLPGHGGILDRFDSHMFCVAFTFLFCTATGGYLS